MNRQENLHIAQLRYLAIIGIVLVITLLACSLNLGIDKANAITQEDIDVISQIIGESLSDENSGIIGSIYDAITTISSNGFTDVQYSSSGHDDNSGRGSEDNLSYEYNPAIGEHKLSFDRTVSSFDYIKEVTDTVRYIFTDQNGNFISEPETNNGLIETINFKGFRSGEIEALSRTSFFVRRDTFLIDGLLSSSNLIQLDGIHHGTGSFKGVSSVDGTQIERTYELKINFLNIQLAKSVVTFSQSIEQGISGALTYSLVIQDPNNTFISRTVKGSVDLAGDGTASLRLNQQQKIFQINLDNGLISDQENEFEGRIISVDIENLRFTLANGTKIQLTDGTSINLESDLFTLSAVQSALQNSPFIRAEGEGFVSNGMFTATEVEFEIDEDNDDENDDIEFNTLITQVDLENATLTLSDGTTIGVDESTEIKQDGDFKNLEEVKSAITEDIKVRADGDAHYVGAKTINYIIEEVEFNIDEGGEDQETISFEDLIESVNISANTLKLENGAVIRLTSETEIRGDYQSLEAIQSALNQGVSVEADGIAIADNESTSVDMVAIKIEFGTENQES